MSYRDRLREGRYTSPSGKAFSFDFDDLGREGGKKSAVLEIPQSDSAEVQDLGNTATKLAIKLYFSGADYDQTADDFYSALRESGPGLLSHPRWGDLPVLALSFGQSEEFVEGAGRAVFDVQFVHAPNPAATVSTSTAPAVAASAREARDATATASAAAYGSPALADIMAAKQAAQKTLRAARSTLMRASGSLGTLSASINSSLLGLESGLDYLVGSPSELMPAIAELMATPALAPVAIVDKLELYLALLGVPAALPTTPAQAALAICTAGAIAASAAEAATVGDLSSRSDAIAAHDSLVALYRHALTIIEAAEEASGIPADPASMLALARAAAAAAALLLEESFSLRVERRAVLEGAATPLDLVWLYYRDLDRLPEFERQNALGGDTLLIIPAGTEIRYYAE